MVYAFVPAKSTSDRVENKNIQYLNGERLFVNALKTLLQCKQVDKVFLDTESEKIYEMVDYLPIEFMHREKTLASNKTDGHKLFLNEVNSNPGADIYVQLLCTSPFINPETIDKAIEKLKVSDEFDSAVLLRNEKLYCWKDGKPTYDINNIPNSVDLSPTEIETMGLYIVKRETAIKTQRRYGDKILSLQASALEAIDVNTPEEFELASYIAIGMEKKENDLLRVLKNFLSSPVFADLLDDIRIDTGIEKGFVVNGFTPNIEGSKLFGRAKTLKLRALEEGEDFRGVYEALSSYESIVDNDIILVENELNDFAYFGELNANLAVRAGASGVVVDGATRDNSNVKKLGIPVFYKSLNAVDVRRRATLESFNKDIRISGKPVHPGDLIFVDSDGLVIIRQEFKKEIINKALELVNKEVNILSDIVEFVDGKKLYDIHGSF
ncbi:hypothetical protein P4E94_07275 [Pontiellaceae bacterium B12219]|nr:hypothetical protein [Pontiellaceae bacterium B12219]